MSEALHIDAAMETSLRPAPVFYRYGRREMTTYKLPTTMMVHVEGHGPRRVYCSIGTNFRPWPEYYIIIKNRRVAVNPLPIAMLTRREHNGYNDTSAGEMR